ncbi:MAG: DegT/DnrJ/EryC1/StrS family aminotransferase [Gammaproteobacteria bacterium]|nr:DegT/DnrJ/EryC1/StrS family aminotransferase [Gammaproteobacteria bacterium]
MNYPLPGIPIKPTIDESTLFKLAKRRPFPSILDNSDIRFVTSGRVAITIALQEMNIGPGCEVLIPAYHCSSMVEPVLFVGAKPVFYKITQDTSVDFDDIKLKLTSNSKLLMATHYFGFHQPIGRIREFCEENNLLLLEDCAHAFMGKINNRPIGSFGDAAIGSAMKFFPVFDGGCLISRYSIEKRHPLTSAGKGFQFKAKVNPLEYSLHYKRLPFLKYFFSPIFSIKDAVWKLLKSLKRKTSSIGPSSSEGGYSIDPNWLDKEISNFSLFVIKNSNLAGITQKRLDNYHYFRTRIENNSLVSPLFDSVPNNTVPYVFPAVVQHPDKLFPVLKSKGVPIVRFGEFLWEGVDADVCKYSVEYSKSVFQFPIHQSLTTKDIDWMADIINKESENYLSTEKVAAK